MCVHLGFKPECQKREYLDAAASGCCYINVRYLLTYLLTYLGVGNGFPDLTSFQFDSTCLIPILPALSESFEKAVIA